MKLDSAIITMLSEELAPFKDDLEVFWDTLDGETDVMEAVGSIIEQIVETDAQYKAVQTIIEKYSNRKNTIQRRRDSLKLSLKRLLLWTGQSKIPHTLATISLRKGAEALLIHDERKIPSQLCKVTITPDKVAIKNQLKAGVQIDGAELVAGPETISIRMK